MVHEIDMPHLLEVPGRAYLVYELKYSTCPCRTYTSYSAPALLTFHRGCRVLRRTGSSKNIPTPTPRARPRVLSLFLSHLAYLEARTGSLHLSWRLSNHRRRPSGASCLVEVILAPTSITPRQTQQ